MANSPQPYWPTCQADDDCIGISLDDAHDHGCVFHTEDDEARERWTRKISAGEPLDARGLTFTTERLEQLLDAVPRDDQNRPRLTEPNFTQARFEGDAEFGGAMFTGNARFGRATFTGNPWFGRATFTGNARFDGATFTGNPWFAGATFTGDAWFAGATFTGAAWFAGATFTGAAWFAGATFTGNTWFDGATFTRHARFAGATFTGNARFDGATFTGNAEFDGATFTGHAELGPMVVGNRAVLVGAAFGSRLDLQVGTPAIDLRRARLAGGGHLRVGWAHIDLTDAEIPQPCILEDGADLLRTQDHLWERLGSDPLPPELTWTARLGSLERATVTGLVLGTIDLGDCRFAGAHDLHQLRVPHTARLKRPPSRLLASRRLLAEEILWRQYRWIRRRYRNEYGGGPPPAEIAEIYRALRTGREARGDEPGAADFYYGEMEMRRHDDEAPRAERFVLWWYWLLSGYALRASRALIALAIVLAGSTWFLSAYGFEAPTPQQAVTAQVAGEPVEIRVGGSTDSEAPSSPQQRRWGDAFWASLESVVLRAPQNADELTDNGRHFTTVLRFIGPILLALAVLSVRGRVKR